MPRFRAASLEGLELRVLTRGSRLRGLWCGGSWFHLDCWYFYYTHPQNHCLPQQRFGKDIGVVLHRGQSGTSLVGACCAWLSYAPSLFHPCRTGRYEHQRQTQLGCAYTHDTLTNPLRVKFDEPRSARRRLHVMAEVEQIYP